LPLNLTALPLRSIVIFLSTTWPKEYQPLASSTLTVAAAVFAIVLAFMIMKAESAEKATEMKKRLWGLIITVVIVIVAVWLLGWLLSNFNTIMTAIRSMGSGL